MSVDSAERRLLVRVSKKSGSKNTMKCLLEGETEPGDGVDDPILS